jgi:N4-gp56 family major capsid protein
MPNTRNLTTTDRIDHPINIHYIQQHLTRIMPNMPHDQFGAKKPMPAHKGDTIKFRRYSNPTAQTTPLIEGEDPTPIMMDKTDISAQVSEYGAYMKCSAWLDLTGLNSDAAERTEWLSDQHIFTIDTLCRNVICASASGAACSNGAGGTATRINQTDIDTAVRTLAGNRARMIEGPIKAGTGQGTSPIRDAYIGIAHTDLMHELQNRVDNFIHFSQYGSSVQLYKNEWGATGNVRWILTTEGYSSGGTYYLPIIGREAYGNVNIPEGNELLIHLTADQVGSPLKMFSTYGWKRNYVCKILNDTWIYVLRCTL